MTYKEIIKSDLEQRKLKALRFVEHIEDHIRKGDKRLKPNAKIICKICGKSIDEIFEKEI